MHCLLPACMYDGPGRQTHLQGRTVLRRVNALARQGRAAAAEAEAARLAASPGRPGGGGGGGARPGDAAGARLREMAAQLAVQEAQLGALRAEAEVRRLRVPVYQVLRARGAWVRGEFRPKRGLTCLGAEVQCPAAPSCCHVTSCP